jgi:hypothetical protein
MIGWLVLAIVVWLAHVLLPEAKKLINSFLIAGPPL